MWCTQFFGGLTSWSLHQAEMKVSGRSKRTGNAGSAGCDDMLYPLTTIYNHQRASSSIFWPSSLLNVVAIVIECDQPWILTSRYRARLTEEVHIKPLQAACRERLPVTHSEQTAQKENPPCENCEKGKWTLLKLRGLDWFLPTTQEIQAPSHTAELDSKSKCVSSESLCFFDICLGEFLSW